MHVLLIRRRRWRGRLTAVAAAVLTATTLTTAPAQPASAQASGCLAVGYQATTWATGPDTGGFLVNLTITNTCDERIEGWTLSLNLAPEHRLSHGWGAIWNTSGAQVTAGNLPWNGDLDPDRSLTIGFIGSFAGTFQDPLTCHINGLPCDGEPENLPPQVTVLSPAEGSGTPITCPVELLAEASDPDGAVDRVEFYLNGTLVGTDDAAPYAMEYTGPGGPGQLGENTVVARAYDDGDPALSADSPPVTFSLTPPPPSPEPRPCASPLPPIPPTVVLHPTPTRPHLCDVPLSAEASDLDNEIDRVEFYVNGTLVATDDQAPYDVVVPGDHPAVEANNTAFARAFDTDNPPQLGDSDAITFSRPPPPPALLLGACTNPVALAEGESAQVTLLNYCAQIPLDIELTVTGDPGVSVSPAGFTFTGSTFEVTVSAAPGSAGAVAQVQVQAVSETGCLGTTVQVSVTAGGG